MPSKSLSLADQLAQLSNPAPVDFDPEEINNDVHSVGSDNDDSDHDGAELGDDENAGREHYVAVGKSALRKNQDLHLDPKYNGAKINRSSIYDFSEEEEDEDDEDEDEGSGSSVDEDIDEDEEDENESESVGVRLTNGKVKNTKAISQRDNSQSKRNTKKNIEMSDEETDSEGSDKDLKISDMRSDEDDDEDLDELSEAEDDEEDDEADDEAEKRAQLKKLIAEEQKTVLTKLSNAAKADAEKGLAVRDQRALFDSFLNSRIKLQSGITSINSFPKTRPDTSSDTFKPAEEAAVKLLNLISNLRQDILEARSNPSLANPPKKRKYAEITNDTPTNEIWNTMQLLENSSTSFRSQTLEKWSAKVQSANQIIPLNKKLNQTATTQTIATQLREHLSDNKRLLAHTRVPRSSAPIQFALKIEEDVDVFDDTDFYQQLLKALVDQRMVDSSNGVSSGNAQWIPAELAELKSKKKKKVVDTRASKGRKLRYHIHEKLQNFMTPDKVLTWHEQQIDELFSSLLGQRLQVREDSNDEDEEIDESIPALRLFSGTTV